MYSQKRDQILAMWNAGRHTLAEIGVVFGLSALGVSSVLIRARRAGREVLTITPAERGRRAGRSRRLWRDGATPGQAAGLTETGAMTPQASEQLRTAWLAGVSAPRIAVMLETSERAVRTEARRLDLPRRKRSG